MPSRSAAESMKEGDELSKFAEELQEMVLEPGKEAAIKDGIGTLYRKYNGIRLGLWKEIEQAEREIAKLKKELEAARK